MNTSPRTQGRPEHKHTNPLERPCPEKARSPLSKWYHQWRLSEDGRVGGQKGDTRPSLSISEVVTLPPSLLSQSTARGRKPSPGCESRCPSSVHRRGRRLPRAAAAGPAGEARPGSPLRPDPLRTAPLRSPTPGTPACPRSPAPS